MSTVCEAPIPILDPLSEARRAMGFEYIQRMRNEREEDEERGGPYSAVLLLDEDE